MSSIPVLTPEEVQLYIQDIPEKNHLLDGLEFNPSQVILSIELAVSEFNMLPPLSNFTINDFPSKAILLNGALWKLFQGQSALAARNNFSYSDGGLQIPVEEKFQLYEALTASYQADFLRASQAYKIATNIAGGWGHVASDYGNFPSW